MRTIIRHERLKFIKPEHKPPVRIFEKEKLKMQDAKTLAKQSGEEFNSLRTREQNNAPDYLLDPFEFSEVYNLFTYYSQNKKDNQDLRYRSLRSFYNRSAKLMKDKIKYRKELEKRFGVKLD